MQAVPMTSRDRLRRDLLAVSADHFALVAVAKGVEAAIAAHPDAEPEKQLAVARRVALREFVARVGWDEQS